MAVPPFPFGSGGAVPPGRCHRPPGSGWAGAAGAAPGAGEPGLGAARVSLPGGAARLHSEPPPTSAVQPLLPSPSSAPPVVVPGCPRGRRLPASFLLPGDWRWPGAGGCPGSAVGVVPSGSQPGAGGERRGAAPPSSPLRGQAAGAARVPRVVAALRGMTLLRRIGFAWVTLFPPLLRKSTLEALGKWEGAGGAKYPNCSGSILAMRCL